MAFSFEIGNHGPGGPRLQKKLLKHFRMPAGEITTAGRQFPIALRVDIQAALETILTPKSDSELVGIVAANMRETPALAQMLGDSHFSGTGPVQYDEIDIGEAVPARCLKNGLWLGREDGVPYAVLFAPGGRFALGSGVSIEIAVPTGELGARSSESFFRRLEQAVSEGRTYRGRVISLEAQIQPFGGGSSVKVHRLTKVKREDVILPQKTLTTLDRNVAGFLESRGALKAMRFQSRKGLLFYGPPGTGKTHTIHYLASQLPNHTTLLVTAGQVALLGEYFRLARFLQPSLMVIEDIDLIARERTQMRGPYEEIMLNQLLNEMDGLREDSDVLFILTTNRPDQIEQALVSRPGRIDQSIEFPLPDDEGRAKLVKLYARNLQVADDLLKLVVLRTKGVSAAFIRELMRRCAQFQIETSAGDVLSQASLDSALEEMLFAGGSLNRRLLGAEQVVSVGSAENSDSFRVVLNPRQA